VDLAVGRFDRGKDPVMGDGADPIPRKGDQEDRPPHASRGRDDPVTRPLRIAAFSAVDLSLPQGHALHLRGLLDALSDLGHAVTLVTPKPRGVPPPTRFDQLRVSRPGWGALSFLSIEILGGWRLRSHCRRTQPDLIYLRQDLYTFSAALVSRLLRIPLVVEVNSSIVDELGIEGHALASRVAAICERFTLRRAERVLVLAPAQRDGLILRTGIDPDRIRVVPIGTHLPARSDVDALRRDLGLDPSTFLIGFAGNLSRIQGVETLIEALRFLPHEEIRLLVVGCGSEEPRLRGEAEGLPGRVIFLGGVPRERSDALLAACQLLVAPYRRPDYDRISGGGDLSSKILTYLAADRPILVSDVPSYEWLSRIGSGESFTAGDPRALARGIETVHARWRDAGGPLHDWPWVAPGPGRRFVEEGRTWNHVAARVAAILRDLAPGSNS
jgi:glycosyltransferase involved in cell wall biosynthesis